jgi:hypothetical protein
MTTFTMRPAHTVLAIAALTLSACSMFKIKPASPAPAPAPTNRPTTQPTTPPTTQPANRPATTPATAPTTTPTQTQGTPTRPAGAATPPATTPATPAATQPTAPRLTLDQIESNKIKEDSARLASLGRTRRYSPIYFTLMFDSHAALMRTATGGVLAPEEEPKFSSLEISLQRANGRGLGIAARAISSAEAYEYSEVALLMGSRRFALDLGVASRTGYDSVGLSGGGAYDTLHIFPRAGFRSRANLGGTDFSAQFRALYYVGLPSLDDAIPNANLEGWSAETGLSWTWNKFPLTANLGYRIERFKVYDREMETSSLVLGAGIMLGRRPRPAAPAPVEAVSPPVTAPPAGNAQSPPRRP